MKATWKLSHTHLGDVAEAIASTSSLRQAAKRLGVNVSTVSRLVAAGKVPGRSKATRRPAPGPGPTLSASLPARDLPPSDPSPHTPAAWAASVRAAYVLSATEDQLVSLADEALAIAQQLDARPSDRLAAMGRFAGLTKQLCLPHEDQAHGAITSPLRFARPA